MRITKTTSTLFIVIIYTMTLFTSCKSPQPTAGSESWNGTFSTKDQGEQKVNLFLQFKDSNGVFNMPDQIPFGLDIYSLKRWNDSLLFKVDFRTGTVTMKGKYVHGDTIKGVSIRTTGLTLPFILYKSTSSNSIYNLPKPKANEPFTIKVKNNSITEKKSKELLKSVIAKYKVDKYIYTKTVMIQDSMIPHSHPILTINTSDTTDENMISTFLHEQMHWFILSKSEKTKKVMVILKKEFPGAKINFPDGSGDIQSTYEHLIVCYYEYQALKELCGQEKADKVMNYLKGRLYKWIYATMLQNEEKIKQILIDNELIL